MALASFPDGSYLELIAIQPKADPAALAAHYWHKFMESDGGPCAWAIRPADFTAEVDRLRVAKVEVKRSAKERPQTARRRTTRLGDRAGRADQRRLLSVPDSRFHAARQSGVSQRQAPSDKWTGIAKVVIGVRDLDAAIARYRQAYWTWRRQSDRDDAEFGAKLAWFPGTPVVLAAPAFRQSWLSARLDRFGEAPCAFILGPRKGSYAMAGPSLNGSDTRWFGPMRNSSAGISASNHNEAACSAGGARVHSRARNSRSIPQSPPKSPKSKPSIITPIPCCPRPVTPVTTRCPSSTWTRTPSRCESGGIAARRGSPRQLFGGGPRQRSDRTKARRLSELGAGSTGHRNHAGQPHRDGTRYRAAAIPMGALRRRPACIRSTTRAGLKEFRPQGVLRR